MHSSPELHHKNNLTRRSHCLYHHPNLLKQRQKPTAARYYLATPPHRFSPESVQIIALRESSPLASASNIWSTGVSSTRAEIFHRRSFP